MGNKIINLFNNSEKSEKKYSELLQQLIAAFSDDFSDIKYFEEVVDFAVLAWNFANMRVITLAQDYENLMAIAAQDDLDVDLLNKMTAYKVKNFREYSNFIVDYEIEKINNDFVLTLNTQEEDNYFAVMSEELEFDFLPEEFEENYINRTAILMKPLQPFLDWYSNLYPEEVDEVDGMKETNTYLISEDIYDVEAWLKNKFDTLFKYELEIWHTNKKEWPKRRNYNMFKKWFQVDISRMVFDVEKEPVSKI